jgi:hypothetical protein
MAQGKSSLLHLRIRTLCLVFAFSITLTGTAPVAAEDIIRDRPRDDGGHGGHGRSGVGTAIGVGIGIGIVNELTRQNEAQTNEVARHKTEGKKPKRAAKKDDKTKQQQQQQQQQGQPHKVWGPCKYGVGFFFGTTEANPKDPDVEVAASFAKKNGELIKETLEKGWGFPKFRPIYNGNVTRREIDGAFETLKDQISDRKADDDCYIKVHFQGHGFNWVPGGAEIDKEKTPKKDADKPHIGFETGTGSGAKIEVYWDYELVDWIKKLSDALKKKGKNSALIVQADFCWAQGFFGDLASSPPSNVHLAWSANKDTKLCQKETPDLPSLFAQGFADAFQGGKKPTVAEAHKAATSPEKLKEFKPGYQSGSSDSVSPQK